jgi:hypothetical protein
VMAWTDAVPSAAIPARTMALTAPPLSRRAKPPPPTPAVDPATPCAAMEPAAVWWAVPNIL